MEIMCTAKGAKLNQWKFRPARVVYRMGDRLEVVLTESEFTEDPSLRIPNHQYTFGALVSDDDGEIVVPEEAGVLWAVCVGDDVIVVFHQTHAIGWGLPQDLNQAEWQFDMPIEERRRILNAVLPPPPLMEGQVGFLFEE